MSRLSEYTVVREYNGHGTMMLHKGCRNETVFVVEYADDEVREVLEDLEVGSNVHAYLERVGRRGNAWRVTAARSAESAVRTELDRVEHY